MKPLGPNAAFEGSAMSVYQEDDPEEEEIGDGLLNSLGGGLEAYDNAIHNFQAKLQRGQTHKSPKIGWTFWFLLKSVVRYAFETAPIYILMLRTTTAPSFGDPNLDRRTIGFHLFPLGASLLPRKASVFPNHFLGHSLGFYPRFDVSMSLVYIRGRSDRSQPATTCPRSSL